MNIERHRISLVTIAGAIIIAGFLTTSLTSYFVSTNSAKKAILNNELPLTSDNVFSEIQRDLLRPVFVSSQMASNTFLRDWVIDGEKDEGKMRKYLREVRERYNAVTSFFVSEKTRTYYHADGILKRVQPEEPRDAWYFRVRTMKPAYEINVDPDMANRDTMTIFINFKVFDYRGAFIGATGVGLTVTNVKSLIDQYQKQFDRAVYFVDRKGNVVLHGAAYAGPTNLRERAGLREALPALLEGAGGVHEFKSEGKEYLLSARYVPELNWILVVEQSADRIMDEFRTTLQGSLVICAFVTFLVVLMILRMVNSFHRRLADMALIDGLTGVANRQSFSISFAQAMAGAKRKAEPMSVLMIDIDHFKSVNDRFGHIVGDKVLQDIALLIKNRIRGWDTLCRWGGEEFVVLLQGTDLDGACTVAEQLRSAIEAEPFGGPDKPLKITISVGVAQYRDGDMESDITDRADRALYRAKGGSRNRIEREC
jgi:diguanylate cyclase (GGDEF)-like protein